MKGGVTLFRGSGVAACRYLESDRSTADDYDVEGGTALAEFTLTGADGEVVVERSLSPEKYAAWVDWTDPLTGTSMGTPRLPGHGRKGSPRFAEMVVNTPEVPVDRCRASPEGLRRTGRGTAGRGYGDSSLPRPALGDAGGSAWLAGGGAGRGVAQCCGPASRLAGG